MASQPEKISGNVPGVFYVTWECDPFCDCWQSFPEFLRVREDCNRSYFFRQPETPEEFEICRELVAFCPCQAVCADGGPEPEWDFDSFPLDIRLRLLIRKGVGAETLWPLLQAGADPNRLDPQGEHPLWLTKRTDVVSLLLDFQADPNATGGRQQEPVLVKHARENPAAALELLRQGANPNRTGTFGSTALMKSQDFSLSRALLAAGAEVNRQNGFGKTALMFVAGHPRMGEIVALLLASGADVTRQTGKGESALHFAVRSGNPEIVRQVLEARAPVNGRDDFGLPPLFDAVARGFEPIARLLRQHGAEPLTEAEHQRALQLAKSYRHPKLS